MAREDMDQRAGRLAGTSAPGERGPDARQGGMRALGAAASRIAGPIVARHGGGALSRLKAEWRAIAGDDIAAATWPDSLARDGALKLRVAPRFALELQHRAPLLCERINGFLGRPAVARLILVQAPLPLPTPRAAPLGAEPAAPGNLAAEGDLAAIADPELRAALAGLGHLVRANKPRGD